MMFGQKNNAGGAWPIGARVMVYNWNPKASYDSNEQQKLYEYMGTLVGFCTDTEATIDGPELYPAVLIKTPDGFLDVKPVHLIRVIEKQDAGGESNTSGLIQRILDFMRNVVK